MTIPGTEIKCAGDYLLRILREQGRVKYSEFYDGSDETRLKLLQGMEMDEETADWYSAEALLDDAVFLFERRGIVAISRLEEKLADGHNNYEIVLTAKGKQFIKSKQKYTFPDLESHL